MVEVKTLLPITRRHATLCALATLWTCPCAVGLSKGHCHGQLAEL
jgi:hypothetical protein